jgi:starch synthase
LNDTVFDVDHDEDRALAAGYETNGYNFEGTDQAALDYALNRCGVVRYRQYTIPAT